MKLLTLITFLLCSSTLYCQQNWVPEGCMENLIGQSLNVIPRDSTIGLVNVLEDSTDYRFLLGRGSFHAELFLDREIYGTPYLHAHVTNNKIDTLKFGFINVGDVDPDLDIISSILRNYLCIDQELNQDQENRFSFCNYDSGSVNIDVKVYWDARKMNVVQVLYTKKE